MKDRLSSAFNPINDEIYICYDASCSVRSSRLLMLWKNITQWKLDYLIYIMQFHLLLSSRKSYSAQKLFVI